MRVKRIVLATNLNMERQYPPHGLDDFAKGSNAHVVALFTSGIGRLRNGKTICHIGLCKANLTANLRKDVFTVHAFGGGLVAGTTLRREFGAKFIE